MKSQLNPIKNYRDNDHLPDMYLEEAHDNATDLNTQWLP